MQVTASMFGSVPLKTYLPDGDIDLSIFTKDTGIRNTWTTQLQARLEDELHNKSAPFKITDVQVINAEVCVRPLIGLAVVIFTHSALCHQCG